MPTVGGVTETQLEENVQFFSERCTGPPKLKAILGEEKMETMKMLCIYQSS